MTVDVCSTCLFKDNFLISINAELRQILYNFLQPKSSDYRSLLNLDTKICYPCEARLLEIGHFRDTVLHSLETLSRQLDADTECEHEKEFTIISTVTIDPETEFTTYSVESAPTASINNTGSVIDRRSTDSSLADIAKIEEKAFKTPTGSKISDPNPGLQQSSKFEAEDEKKRNQTELEANIEHDIKVPVNKIIKPEFVLEEELVVKIGPPLAPDSFALQTTVKITKETDHDYVEKVESSTQADDLMNTETQGNEPQDDTIQQESDQQWYIKVLTNEEQLERMAAKRRGPHFNSAPHKCVNCVIVFKNAAAAKLHEKQCHDESVGRFACFICTRRFRRLMQLNQHVSLHCSNVYVCAHCSFDTYDQRVIQAHSCLAKLVITGGEGGDAGGKRGGMGGEGDGAGGEGGGAGDKGGGTGGICPRSLAVSQARSALRERLLREAWARCQFDTMTLGPRGPFARFYDHLPRNKSAARKPRPKRRKNLEKFTIYECQFCNKTFKSRAGAMMHVDLRHKKLPKEQCKVCNRFFKNRYSLQNHMRHEHSNKPKDKLQFYCEECDHTFYNAAGLKTHLQSSLKHITKDEFKFTCDQCDRRFFYERDLDDHVKVAHQDERPFACLQCDKHFATERALKRHLVAAHAQRPRTRKCDVCGAMFNRKLILEAHMRRHTGERPYQCECCPSTFSNSGALYKHKQIRHGEGKVKVSNTGSSGQGTGWVGQGTGGVGQGTGGVGQGTGGVGQEIGGVGLGTGGVGQGIGGVGLGTGGVGQGTGGVGQGTGGVGKWHIPTIDSKQ